MEEAYYLIDNSRSEHNKSGFIYDGKTLKQFMAYTYSDTNSIIENFCIETDYSSIELESNEDFKDAIFTKSVSFKDLSGHKNSHELIKSKHKVGLVYPRIYRPFLRVPDLMGTPEIFGKIGLDYQKTPKKNVLPPFDKTEFALSINQLHVLIENLKSIFLTIHPAKENFSAFGHNIRNLLILACTEIESQFRGILKENGCSKKTYNTKDFVKLLDPLRLDSYRMKLVYYPWINSIRPFLNWGNEKPTESLKWYYNYNAVKHNRAGEFNKGTLQDTILAISAVAILLFAQYGDEIFNEDPLFNHFFELTYIPKWEISDYYIPPHREDEWKIQGYFENC